MGLSSSITHLPLFISSVLFYYHFLLIITSSSNPLHQVQATSRSLYLKQEFIHQRDDDLQSTVFHTFSHMALPPSQSPLPSPPAAGHENITGRPIAVSPSSSLALPPTISTSSSATRVLNVMSFGAVGDGVTDDSSAFKFAFDTACQEEVEQQHETIIQSPNILLVPRGYSFLLYPTVFTGSCNNGVVFQVEGSIVAPEEPESWPKNISKRQWLVFYKISGMTMQGGGVIDGRGQKWWNLPCKPHRGIHGTTLPGPCDSPVAMRFYGGSDITVTGITVTNSPEFHIRFDNCHNITIKSITIRSPSNSPNTDGIHVENTRFVNIHNSLISNGDDCVSIGSGSHNIDIRNVTCGPSHGISIGSLGARNSHACVSNVTVTDTVIKRSVNGVRIKTWQGGSGCVNGVRFSNIKMDMVRYPIIIDQYYCDRKGKKCGNLMSNVFVTDVLYENIYGTYDEKSGSPVKLMCSDGVPCTELKISNVELVPAPAGAAEMDIEEDDDDDDEAEDEIMGRRGKVVVRRGYRVPVCLNAYGSVENSTSTVPSMGRCLIEGTPPQFLPVAGNVGIC